MSLIAWPNAIACAGLRRRWTSIQRLSYGYWSPYFDINQPVNSEGTVLFRVTGEYSQTDSFIDVLETERFSINPTLTLTNNEDTTLTVQGFFSRHEQQAYPGLPVYGTLLGDFKLNDDFYFGDPNIDPSRAEQNGVTATFDHEFNEIWSASIKARYSDSSIHQFAQASFLDATGTGGTPLLPPSMFDVSNMEHKDAQREFSIAPTVQAKFDLGRSENVVLLGADYSHVTEQGVIDLPLKFHPAAIRASAVFDKPNGVVGATGGNAKLPHRVALEPVAAMIPA